MSSSQTEWAGNAPPTYKQEAVGSRGMVTSNHPLASAVGAEMLAMDGNTVDAAIATAFARTVVEPMMVGIFGAGFVNLYDARTGEVVNIDNYLGGARGGHRRYVRTRLGHLARLP